MCWGKYFLFEEYVLEQFPINRSLWLGVYLLCPSNNQHPQSPADASKEFDEVKRKTQVFENGAGCHRNTSELQFKR